MITIHRLDASHVEDLYNHLSWRGSGCSEPPDAVPVPAKTAAIMREHLGQPSLLVWAARDTACASGLVGYISVALILKPDGRRVYYVDELWVPPPFRRRGIAQLLVEKVLDHAAQAHIWRVRLHSADTKAARHLYLKTGFDVAPGGWSEYDPSTRVMVGTNREETS